MASDLQISQIQALLTQKDYPRFLAVQHEIQATDYFLKEARSNILPDLRLNLYKQNFGDGFDFRGFDVGIRIPVRYPFEQIFIPIYLIVFFIVFSCFDKKSS